LIAGIVPGGPLVTGALRRVVESGISAAKSALGISSPSKVFAQIGEFTTEGFAGGVEDSAPMAGAAVSAMVEPPRLSSLTSPEVRGGQVGGGSQATAAGPTVIFQGPVTFSGLPGAEAIVPRFGELLTLALEGDAAALGQGKAA